MTISLPPELAQDFRRVAREEGKTGSELARAAFLNYLEDKNRWKYLRKIGTETARKFKIKTESDVEKIIDSVRK